ncbi:MAG: PTS sugar transporter subunit IIA [Acidobacteria bacterium]|nr:PTS sugar transporter subunit IIA [Acidobacteriota bacterium]
MRLLSLTRPELIFLDLPGSDSPTVLQSLATRVAEIEGLGDAQEIYRRILEREQLASTGIGAGVAIPHCKLAQLREPILTIGITREPIDFAAIDGAPVQLFLLILSPEEPPAAHLKALSTVSRWIKEASPAPALLAASDVQDILSILEAAAAEE